MKQLPIKPVGYDHQGEEHRHILSEEPIEETGWQSTDPETLAKQVTAPLIESMRERFKQMDVSKYRQQS